MMVQEKLNNKDQLIILIIVATEEAPETRTQLVHRSCLMVGMISMLLLGSEYHYGHSSSDEEKG